MMNRWRGPWKRKEIGPSRILSLGLVISGFILTPLVRANESAQYLKDVDALTKAHQELAQNENDLIGIQLRSENLKTTTQDYRLRVAKRIHALSHVGAQRLGRLFIDGHHEKAHRLLGIMQFSAKQEVEKLLRYRLSSQNLATELENMNQKKISLQAQIQEISRRQKALNESEKKRAAALKEQGVESLLLKKGSLLYPIESTSISQFGLIHDDSRDFTFFQSGIYFLKSTAQNVRSVESGRVVFVDRVPYRGTVVVIEHPDSYFSVYANLKSALIQPETTVMPGQIIGQTDLSNFYFELRNRSTPIDPKPWFKTETKGQL